MRYIIILITIILIIIGGCNTTTSNNNNNNYLEKDNVEINNQEQNIQEELKVELIQTNKLYIKNSYGPTYANISMKNCTLINKYIKGYSLTEISLENCNFTELYGTSVEIKIKTNNNIFSSVQISS